MRIYLAARYDQHGLMLVYAGKLESAGHQVTSRWIRQATGDMPDGCTVELMNQRPSECAPHAQTDMDDIRRSNVLVCFTEWPSSTGGRHVEFGYALALGIRIVIVGPREHIFHTIPQVEHYSTREKFEETWKLVQT